jgi:hypothetical protein
MSSQCARLVPASCLLDECVQRPRTRHLGCPSANHAFGVDETPGREELDGRKRWRPFGLRRGEEKDKVHEHGRQVRLLRGLTMGTICPLVICPMRMAMTVSKASGGATVAIPSSSPAQCTLPSMTRLSRTMMTTMISGHDDECQAITDRFSETFNRLQRNHEWRATIILAVSYS